jgi:hypothetical protein
VVDDLPVGLVDFLDRAYEEPGQIVSAFDSTQARIETRSVRGLVASRSRTISPILCLRWVARASARATSATGAVLRAFTTLFGLRNFVAVARASSLLLREAPPAAPGPVASASPQGTTSWLLLASSSAVS